MTPDGSEHETVEPLHGWRLVIAAFGVFLLPVLLATGLAIWSVAAGGPAIRGVVIGGVLGVILGVQIVKLVRRSETKEEE